MILIYYILSGSSQNTPKYNYNGYIVGNAKTKDSDSQVAPCSWISGASSTMQNAVAQEDGRQPHWEQWQTTIVL